MARKNEIAGKILEGTLMSKKSKKAKEIIPFLDWVICPECEAKISLRDIDFDNKKEVRVICEKCYTEFIAIMD